MFSLVLLTLSWAALARAQCNVTCYAPNVNATCPDISVNPLVRVFTAKNQSLNVNEAAYNAFREQSVLPDAWATWLGDGSGIGYDFDQFMATLPKVGIGLSGGGYRAAQYGAGVLSGLDARNESAQSAGTGGLLQVAHYLSGLSGGSWLTGSLYMNDWPTIKDMVYGNGGNLSGWILDLPLASPDGDDVFNQENQDFYGSILWSVYAKADTGIDTSITDPWARMISYHFLNDTTRSDFFTNDSDHGAGDLWSNIPNLPSWKAGTPPYPLIMADSRPVGSNLTTVLAPNSTVYEITPHEFGSWDPSLSAMVNLTYAGTHLTNGQPSISTGCVTGFDQAGFMMGTSASLFNQILDFADNKLSGFSASDSAKFLYVLARQLREVRTRADDVANWPNPFNNVNPDTFQDSNSTWLELIDGSSNLENVPLGPLFVKSRELDVIVGVDASADEVDNLWPNGTSIIFSSQRMSTILNTTHQAFPPLPSNQTEFISTGINQRPTFFGCDPTQTPPEWPLFIYFPNSPPNNGDNPATNTGTFQIGYSPKQSQVFIDQAHLNTVGGFKPNSTGADSNWGKCLQCAAIDRARYKVSPVASRSLFCETCFQQYCFNPNSPPSASELVGRKQVFVDPDPQGVSKVTTFLKKEKFPLIGGLIALIAVIGAIVGFLIWRRKKQAKEAQYKRVSEFHEGDDAPWNRYSDSRYGEYSLPAYKRHSDIPLTPVEETQSPT